MLSIEIIDDNEPIKTINHREETHYPEIILIKYPKLNILIKYPKKRVLFEKRYFTRNDPIETKEQERGTTTFLV